ncbi:MAG: glycosyltransferase family 1 protein [Verrucomicrobia bacterium]|nr:glycosyltransferase family 1 protein [Verrucomicrobiota bacterium]
MKILLYTDLTVGPAELFWHRDLGLLTQAFRELGHEASLAIHPSDTGTDSSMPGSLGESVLWVSKQDVRDSSWWRRQNPDLVILGLWTRPKYDSVRRAVLRVTPNLIERADSDGMRTASCGLKPYARRRFDYCRDLTAGWSPLISPFVSFLYSATSVLATPWLEHRLARTLSLIPRLVVETPGAADLWHALSLHLRVSSCPIQQIAHPVQTSLFQFQPNDRKSNRVVAVGRWGSYQKNLPALLTALREFLRQFPDWEAEVVGAGLPDRSPIDRCQFTPAVPPHELAQCFRSSKILLFSSRYESFLLAGAEALTAGCSVLGPVSSVSTDYFRSFFADHPIPENASSLAGSLGLESKAWAMGRRDPAKISFHALREFSPIAVAQRFLAGMPAFASLS